MLKTNVVKILYKFTQRNWSQVVFQHTECGWYMSTVFSPFNNLSVEERHMDIYTKASATVYAGEKSMATVHEALANNEQESVSM